MAAGNFTRCHEVTAKWEGGWSDHPADPGGKTMYGITEAVYHAWRKARNLSIKPVRYITRAEAMAIYQDQYWTPVGAETLAAGVDLATYDAGVNSSIGRAKTWLKASIGGSDVQTVKNICAKRLSFVRSLKTWATFGKGWTNRIVDIEAKGVAWALAAVTTPAVVKKSLEREADTAGKKSGGQVAGAGTAAGGGAVAQQTTDHTALFVFLALAAVVTIAFLYRAHINKKRAAAYAAEASKVAA